jgi:PAS domain S-box-containing protein
MGNLQFEIDPLHYIIAGGALLLTLYRIALRPKLNRLHNIIDNINKIESISSTVLDMKKELFANGGSSLRDSVDRIETRIVTVEEKQNIYLMDAKHGLFETNETGRWITVNRTLCRMLNATEKELLGNGWINFIGAESVNRFNHCMANEVEYKQISTMVTTEGNHIMVSITANPLRSTLNKKLIGYLGTIDETI